MAENIKNKKLSKNQSEKSSKASRKPSPVFSVRQGQEMEIEITGLGSTGEGVGRFGDIAVFVPGALTGEKVRASAAFVKKNFIIGKLLEIITASPHRVAPACPVYEACGGCQLQHLSYEAELEEKREQVKAALERIGHLRGVKVMPTISSNHPLYYRNKMQFPVAGKNGKLQIGCFALNTHRVIDVTDCCIQKEKNNEIAAIVRTWMKQYKIMPYDEDKRTGTVRHIMGRVGVQTGEVMVCLVTAQDTVPHLKELVKMLKAAIPGVKSVVQNVNKRSTNVILGEKTKLIAGEPTIKDKIGALKFNISAQSFFQVNSEQAEKLYNTALEFADLKGTETVVDLYCGTGTITLFMAQKAKQALGIEIVPSAIRDAKKNARANLIENVDFLLGDAAVEMPKLAAEGLRPDVVILDPPRAGCEERVLAAIVKVKPERVVYVSCNPATLARDLAYLHEHGFNIDKVQPCDMFSRTHHVETVVLLIRKK
ncbi:MAG: 23S rRNA (uracil(1939)-C(5))-methyltransferase RlmD [Acidaminococcaceae bacterium]|nr:23S rRNA (uracil(1939)-C(5))-methyltransferase RlmD [Acidaminococcaceae bacterium]